MFITMNRFNVIKGCEEASEQAWLSRDSQLEKVRGFIELDLLKGPQADDHRLQASHTVWRSHVNADRTLTPIGIVETPFRPLTSLI